MLDWSKPVTVKQLRGYLRLIRHYRKFIKGYGVISKPPTKLLKKDSICWNHAAEEAFKRLKKAKVCAPVVALPNFKEDCLISKKILPLKLMLLVQV